MYRLTGSLILNGTKSLSVVSQHLKGLSVLIIFKTKETSNNIHIHIISITQSLIRKQWLIFALKTVIFKIKQCSSTYKGRDKSGSLTLSLIHSISGHNLHRKEPQRRSKAPVKLNKQQYPPCFKVVINNYVINFVDLLRQQNLKSTMKIRTSLNNKHPFIC